MKRYGWLICFCLAGALSAWGQWSGSGSNGSDGALNLNSSTPGVVNGVLVFDPVALKLDPDGDNVYHFTTINISGISVVFQANKMRNPGPVIFLASGAVTLQGGINFNGENGHPSDSNQSIRRPSVPGPGGFPGGSGAPVGGVAMAGMGPGGGKVPSAVGACPAGFVTNAIPSWCSSVGAPATYGNNLLQPLIGGSGGSGQSSSGQNFGAGGGAGGGAIRISSSAYIAFGSGINSDGSVVGCNGSAGYYVSAQGGQGGDGNGGPGTGGAIHLQAPFISGCGTHLYVASQNLNNFGTASPGRVRLDANSVIGVGTSGTNPLTGALVDIPLVAPSVIKVVSINGVTVPANPGYQYSTPDVTTNASGAVPVVIQATNIPVSTPVTVFLTSETGADVATSSVNLTGTTASSTATINVTLPQGVSRLLARAVW